MKNKIEWYQEVLALEPGSRIFFPLAKLFADSGQWEDAEKTLRQGLDRHPDAMEARLLLVQVLSRLGRVDDAREQVDLVIKPLERYPAFWSVWAGQAAEKDRDFAAFLMLVASRFSGKPLTWTDVILEGLHALTDRLLGEAAPKAQPAQPAQPAPVAPAESAAEPVAAAVAAVAVVDAEPTGEGVDTPYEGPAPDAGSYRTRTMADLLASQGDLSGAMGIYKDLAERSRDEAEKADLEQRVKDMQAALADAPKEAAAAKAAQAEDPFGKHAKNRLMSTLEALAARLESRIQA